jgi:hypothetical protein
MRHKARSAERSALTEEQFLTRKQAAEMLGLAASTLAVWQSRGSESAVPMRRHGRRAMYAVSDLLAWSKRRRT